jgi:hypothetical protein
MTPRTFMNSYRKLHVLLDDNRLIQVDVHQYLINRDDSPHNAKAAVEMWHNIKRKLDEQARHESQTNGGATHQSPVRSAHSAIALRPQVTHEALIRTIDPFVTEAQLAWVPFGKGAPNAIKVYLRLAVRYGFATGEGLQRFADGRYVGLDCSGFVSNYLVAMGRMAAPQVPWTSAQSYDVTGHRRATPESVRALDVMVWSNGSHVAILDSGPVAHRVAVPVPCHHGHAHSQGHVHGFSHAHAAPAGMHTQYKCIVVESNGRRGLGSEEYTLLSVDRHGVFTVRRQDGTKHHVHIIDRGLRR